MKKNGLSLLLILCMLALPCLAEPLPLGEDLSGTGIYPEEVPETEASYVYRYAYPYISGEDEAAEVINSFYAYLAEDALGFAVPMTGDELESEGLTGVTEIGYEVTCNNDEWFSLKIMTDAVFSDGTETHGLAGHTFARKGGTPGSSVSLPHLLGILGTEENDTWLEDRQTARADSLVREMILDRLDDTARTQGATLLTSTDPEEALDCWFFPEEDFWLDENGNPVFFILPGVLTAEDGISLLFPITLEEIEDEM